MEKEDRLQTQGFLKAKKSLPGLKRTLASVRGRLFHAASTRERNQLTDEERSLVRQINRISRNQDQTDYLCNLASLLTSHTKESVQRRESGVKQWEEEMMAQSVSIHERQKRARILWDRQITIRFASSQSLAGETYNVHINTTLPQLSIMVHRIQRTNSSAESYFPQTYNFWVVKPETGDPFQRCSVGKWIELLDADRMAYQEMLPVQTSLGEAIYYDSGVSSVNTFEPYLDRLDIPFFCLLMAPRTTAEWRIPQRVGANLQRVDEYVEYQNNASDNPFSQKGALCQKYMEMVGKRQVPRKILSAAGGWCGECNVKMLKVEACSTHVCPECGISETYLENTIKGLPFGHAINATQSTYKRIVSLPAVPANCPNSY